MGHTLDFGCCIKRHVACARIAAYASLFVLAEIDVSGKFAHDFEITPAHTVAAQRGNSLQGRSQLNRPQINVKAKLLPQAQQASLRTLFQRQRVPSGSADRAQQYRVGRTAPGESFFRKRRAATVDRHSTKRELAKFEVVPERGSAITQQLHRCASHFRANTIARQYSNTFP